MQGNDHLVYNGTFYYFNLAKAGVVSFEMASGLASVLTIPRSADDQGMQGSLLTTYASISRLT